MANPSPLPRPVLSDITAVPGHQPGSWGRIYTMMLADATDQGVCVCVRARVWLTSHNHIPPAASPRDRMTSRAPFFAL